MNTEVVQYTAAEQEPLLSLAALSLALNTGTKIYLRTSPF